MNPHDIAIIIADQLPIPQAFTWLCWYLAGDDYKVVVQGESYRWYMGKHASEISEFYFNRRPRHTST